MSEIESIDKFVSYTNSLTGDEKGEAQVFLDRLFQAFGHDGYKEAGAILEHRVRRKNRNTAFADLFWEPRLLLEMKKGGENLQRHYDQMRDYWYDVYPKPRYAILCNFSEFWIYDFFNQSEPVDKILIEDLPRRYTALNFMFPDEKKPLFKNDMEFVSRAAADKVAKVFNSLIDRGEDRKTAQRFILQCVFSLFAEDFNLLPRGLFTELINDCKEGSSSYDLFGSLFNQMNNPERARGGRFQNVDYFDGGLFSEIDSLDLSGDELKLLSEAASEDWSKVQPPIFGALFEGSMGKKDRHAWGAHFTHEADIKKIVRPTIEKPWKEKIENANTLKELMHLRQNMNEFLVLDPACGCGNFLYVAFMELRRLELMLIQKVHDNFKARSKQKVGVSSRISPKQFYGIDINSFAHKEAEDMIKSSKENQRIIFPYLIADELFRTKPPGPQRFVIDFHPRDVISSSKFIEPFRKVKSLVLPTRQKAADKEVKRNEEVLKDNPNSRINRHHANFLRKWWLLSYPREEMIKLISKTTRYIVCSQVTKRPIFEFISSFIRPNAALIVFPLEDDYSFGILQSNLHWMWFQGRCSTLTERFRYTSNTIFDSFPWPQSPKLRQVKKISKRAFELRKFRKNLMAENKLCLRDLYH